MTLLRVLAGPKAAAHIRESGLQAGDISAVFGASGAAKWLGIYGLDRAIFSDWLQSRQREVYLLGTSVGAFKLAAAARRDPGAAMDTLAEAYITQSYPNGIARDDIQRETAKILDAYLGDDAIAEILSHPFLRYACASVRCSGLLASEARLPQQLGAATAMLTNVFGRGAHRAIFQRVVFSDPRSSHPVMAHDGYRTAQVALNEQNFMAALVSSGSIPVVMHGVRDIPGAPPGIYRDGGLLDYHPVPGHLWADEGLILYPHFYPYLKAGWFDKYYRRQAGAALLQNVVMLSPSPQFLESLELGRIPDRNDFLRFRGRDAERIRLWREVADKSQRLGEEFLELTSSGRIRAVVEDII